MSADDARWMELALDQARLAAGEGEVPIGAVVVAGGRELARGYNRTITDNDPTAHAEVLALRDAAYGSENYRLGGLTLYVTLEPCTMCAGAISNARISRVVYGAPDVKGGAVENGVRFFDQPTCHHRPEVTGGILAENAAEILKSFFRDRRK